MKRCSKCKVEKSFNNFAKHPKGIGGLDPRCNACRNKDYRRAYAEGRLKKYPYTYAKQLRRYKLTLEDYNFALARQRGKCLICDTKCVLVVDHDHKTGVFRGLLCTKCNTGIGKLKDSIILLKKAIKYLEKSGAVIPDGLLNRQS